MALISKDRLLRALKDTYLDNQVAIVLLSFLVCVLAFVLLLALLDHYLGPGAILTTMILLMVGSLAWNIYHRYKSPRKK